MTNFEEKEINGFKYWTDDDEAMYGVDSMYLTTKYPNYKVTNYFKTFQHIYSPIEDSKSFWFTKEQFWKTLLELKVITEEELFLELI
jgi:hypothetical protein